MGHVNGVERSDRLYFHDHQTVHKQIETIAAVERVPSIGERKWLLPHER